MHPKEANIKTDIKNNAFKIVEENKNLKNITTVHNHAINYRLDLYVDAKIIGFIDYRVEDEILQKIYISHISIDAYYQRNGLGTYLLNCLKKEFMAIALLSFSKSLNVFYEKNNFVVDVSKRKLKNNTNYVWNKQSS